LLWLIVTIKLYSKSINPENFQLQEVGRIMENRAVLSWARTIWRYDETLAAWLP